jgi:hypothetical protein
MEKIEMKTFALLAAAGLASAASAQDIVITINPIEGTINAAFQGTLPAANGAVAQVWSDIGIRLTGDAGITVANFSPSYTSFLDPTGPDVTGNGTNNVLFVASAGGPLFGTPFNNSNPFTPFSFTYGGSFGAFTATLVSQNTLFTTLPAPFGGAFNFQNANGTPGPLSFRIDIVPAPATAALLGLGGLAAARRRR